MYLHVGLIYTLVIGTLSGVIFMIAAIRKYFGNRVAVGDVVLYTNPRGRADTRNIITTVLSVIPRYKNAVIRIQGTTLLVAQKHLQVLNIDPAFPLLVPEKPEATVALPTDIGIVDRTIHEGDRLPPESIGLNSWGNKASFMPIPISWLRYNIRLDKAGRLETAL